MKNIKCPLCGEEYEFNKITISKKYEYRQARCLVCKYSLDLSNTMTGAKKIAEEFISKFPSIVRLKIGDELVVKESNSLYHYFRVTEIDINSGIFWGICLKTDNLEQFKYEDVAEWPWEFKQEEGAEQ